MWNGIGLRSGAVFFRLGCAGRLVGVSIVSLAFQYAAIVSRIV
jgi:hypothetical protein